MLKEEGVLLIENQLSNFFTFFCTLKASFGTLLTMLMVMLFAFIAAVFTDLCAKGGQLGNIWTVSGDCLSQIPTDISAFPVQPNTRCHHFYILFLQTCIKTVIAGFHTFMKHLQQILVFFMGHFISPPYYII
jgi:hypothetical protein